MISLLIIFTASLSCALADVSHIIVDDAVTSTTEYYPPRPYAFAYQAGRAPGHVDRTHSEVGDGAGTVRGAYSYVDPLNRVRTVEYVADENGFYPQLSHPVTNTKAVDLATKRHLSLYKKIAAEHADPNFAARYAAEHAQDQVVVAGPKNTPVVERAREKHLSLFEKIAAEHARIGEEQLAQRLAFEAEHGQQSIDE